jgi:hypothetical protein
MRSYMDLDIDMDTKMDSDMNMDLDARHGHWNFAKIFSVAVLHVLQHLNCELLRMYCALKMCIFTSNSMKLNALTKKFDFRVSKISNLCGLSTVLFSHFLYKKPETFLYFLKKLKLNCFFHFANKNVFSRARCFSFHIQFRFLKFQKVFKNSVSLQKLLLVTKLFVVSNFVKIELLHVGSLSKIFPNQHFFWSVIILLIFFV